MKKLIIAIIILASSVTSYSQSIIGKWSMTMSEGENSMDFVFDFAPDGNVTFLVNSTTGDVSTVQILSTATVSAKYEYSGKALCIIFNDDAKAKASLKFSDSVPEEKKNQVTSALRSYMPGLEKELMKRLSAYTSAGMYSQILQLNDASLVIKYPGQDAEIFKRTE